MAASEDDQMMTPAQALHRLEVHARVIEGRQSVRQAREIRQAVEVLRRALEHQHRGAPSEQRHEKA